ncbi:MAG: RagB/SusD family nutrient uptake outer membrane protein [Bacteroidales bacterium]|nr:RagB/SusD family nutrient uptake outer membrane protein [Bacteroidales bacterium]
MKNIIKYSIVAAAMGFAGCTEDFLTQDVKGTQVLDNYFNNEKECLAQVYGCYQTLAYDDWWQIYNTYILADMATDDGWMNNTTQSQDGYDDLVLYQGKTTSGTLSNFWQYRYKGIHRCNTVLEYVPTVSSISEDKKNRMMAEAKFIRAYSYFELAKNFGGVPLVLEMVVEDGKNVTRATLDETYTQIEKDFLEAIEYLPLRSETINNGELGRATKGAAMGLLAKTYLYHEKYTDAEKYLDEVIKSGEYDLLDDFSKVWNMDYNNSVEGVFEIQTSGDISYSVGERISVVAGSRDDSGWSWGGPSSDLENAYTAAGDDIRKFCTIIKHGATSIPNETDASIFPYQVSPSKHKCGRVNAKLYIPQARRIEGNYDAPHIALNYRLLRYADILLMAAEVKNQLGKDDEARKYLNQVRTRVNLADVTASGNDLKQAIRLERRLELAFEGNRLYDIRRWTDSNGKKVVCNLFGPNGSWVKYNTETSTDEFETTNLIEPQNEGYDFKENRDELFPIPNTEIVQSNGSLVQNPGY